MADTQQELEALLAKSSQSGITPSVARALSRMLVTVRRDSSGEYQAIQVDGADQLTVAQAAAVAEIVDGQTVAGTLLTDWQTNGALALISANGGAEAVALDAAVTCDGQPMVRCTQGSSGTYIADLLLTAPVYLAQMQSLQIPVRFDSNASAWTGSSNSLQLWLWDDSTGTRQWRLNASLRALDASELRTGATHMLSLAPGANSQGWAFGGTSAPTNTTGLDAYSVYRLRLVVVNVTSGAQCWVGPIRANGRRKPVITLCLDGQYSSQHNYLLPMIEAQGLRCSMALQHSLIGSGGRMTEAQLARAYTDGGHEFIHHTYDGSKTAGYQSSSDFADAAAITADIAAGNAYLSARGWARGLGYAVHGGSTHPYNASVSAARQAIVTAGYQAAGTKAIRRGAWVMGALERLQPMSRPSAVDPYSVNGAIQWTSTDDAADLTAIVTRAKARGEWGIFTGHRSVVSGASSLEVLNSDFLTFIQSLGDDYRAGKVDVLPFGEACRYYGLTT